MINFPTATFHAPFMANASIKSCRSKSSKVLRSSLIDNLKAIAVEAQQVVEIRIRFRRPFAIIDLIPLECRFQFDDDDKKAWREILS